MEGILGGQEVGETMAASQTMTAGRPGRLALCVMAATPVVALVVEALLNDPAVQVSSLCFLAPMLFALWGAFLAGRSIRRTQMGLVWRAVSWGYVTGATLGALFMAVLLVAQFPYDLGELALAHHDYALAADAFARAVHATDPPGLTVPGISVWVGMHGASFQPRWYPLSRLAVTRDEQGRRSLALTTMQQALRLARAEKADRTEIENLVLATAWLSKSQSSSLKPTDPVFLKQARAMGRSDHIIPADARAGVPVPLYAAVDLDLAHHPETVTTAAPATWRVPVLSGGRKIAFYEIENGPHPSVVMVSDSPAFFDLHADAVRRIEKALGPKARCYAIEGGAWFGLIGFEGDRIALTFFGNQGLGVYDPKDPVVAAWRRLNDKDVYVDQRARALLKTLYSKTSPQ